MPTFKPIDRDVIGAGHRFELSEALDLDGSRELALQCEVTNHAGSTLTVTLGQALRNTLPDYTSLIAFVAPAASGASSRAYVTEFERFLLPVLDFADPSNTANSASVLMLVVPKK
jgi:hypothetical protein